MATALVQASRSMRAGIVIAGVVGIIATLFAWRQTHYERAIDTEDIDRRARALAHVLSYTVHDALKGPPGEVAAQLGRRLDGYSRLMGCAVFGPEGQVLAAGSQLKEYEAAIIAELAKLSELETEFNTTLIVDGPPLRMRAERLLGSDGSTEGSFVVIHNTSFIDERASARLTRALAVVILTTLVLLVLVVGVTWLTYDRPLQHLADWMQRLRIEDSPESPPVWLPLGRLATESDRLAASYRAARTATFAGAHEAARKDRAWTSDRLRTHALDCLGIGNQLVVVSSREPYMHTLRNGQPHVVVPPGGVVTALDPVLQSCGGVWIAHGTGECDRETASPDGRLMVPPGQSRYALRRLWLTPAEHDAFYGCCNDAIWPMCLLAHERPIFRTSDWMQYVAMNRRFADAVLEEVGTGNAVVLVQDYQMALVPRMVREIRPDLRICLFWHIPWPSVDAIRICPWRDEILRGMLGADLVGFHLQQYCNNFLDTIDRMLEARIDRDHFNVEVRGHATRVRPQPISVQPWSDRGVSEGHQLELRLAALRRQHGLDGIEVAVGVDRVDHTKGLPERLRAFAHFLHKYPQHIGKISLVQLAAPSRLHLKRYRDHLDELIQYAEEINAEFSANGWRPIHLLVDQHDAHIVHDFLTMASIAIVSSLHDGMNLVAKEYVLAQKTLQGCLILSEFAGAAQDLSDAIVINPYDTEQFADAIRYAVEMPSDERVHRMTRLRRQVEENNIYRWAAEVLSSIPPPTLGTSRPATKKTSAVA
jgi:trehalose-6-phosphate synthase